jgi:IS30 family transposase
VGCETIYAFIYRSAQQAEQLWRYLTRRHKRRRQRRSRPSQDTIKDIASLSKTAPFQAILKELGKDVQIRFA